MSDKRKIQAKHEKHTQEKKHHGHEEISKEDLKKVHGGNPANETNEKRRDY